MSGNSRNFGVDLLRIVSMFMVVMLHVLSRGGILEAVVPMSVNYMTANLLETGAYCAVNCYALISGYVGYKSKHKISGILNLTFCVLFYIIAITVFSIFVFDNVGITDAVKSLLFLRSGGYWYYRAYLGAFFFFPILDIAVETFDRKKSQFFIGAVMFLYAVLPLCLRSDMFSSQGGYSPVWLMIMYFTGAYMRKYNLAEGRRSLRYFGIYAAAVFITFISIPAVTVVTNAVLGRTVLEDFLLGYTSPMMVICAVALLIAFANLKTGEKFNKIVCAVAPLTFGVYLIHMQYFVRIWLTGRFEHLAELNPIVFVPAVIGVVLAIYVVCTFIDYIRSRLFKVLKINKLSKIFDAN